MDTLWRNNDVSHREKIAQELLLLENKLSKDFFGAIVLRNCNIAQYKLNKSVWQEKERALQLVHGGLNDKPAGKKKRRRDEVAKPAGLEKKRKKRHRC